MIVSRRDLMMGAGASALCSGIPEAQRHPRFDIKRFHDLVLSGGRSPLAVLERRVRAGIARWV
jgi:hypothetical protein